MGTGSFEDGKASYGRKLQNGIGTVSGEKKIKFDRFDRIKRFIINLEPV